MSPIIETVKQINHKEMYIIKVKGKSKIPDYIQIRDKDFVLIAYFRVDRYSQRIEKLGFKGKDEKLKEIIHSLPYGKIQKLNL